MGALCALSAAACGSAFDSGTSDGSGGSAGADAGGCAGAEVACGGACVDLMSSAAHCGACFAPCADGVCSGGVCAPAGCPEGLSDCDGDPSNGCEADLLEDRAHCGGCGASCVAFCAKGACNDPKEVAAGAGYTCAVLADGSVWCWGRNDWGNLGDGTTQAPRVRPTRVVGLPAPAVRVAVGPASARTHTCAALADGTVACWGAGGSGQLGDGATTGSPVPVQVAGLSDVAEVAVGGAHTCVIAGSGDLLCWGQSGFGQVGYGGQDDQPAPVLLFGDAARVATGVSHTCALSASGAVACWGANASGQLGNASNQQANAPAPAVGLPAVIDLAAGAQHTCAIAAMGGAAWCWGEGQDFRLGTGLESDVLTPQEVPVLMGAATLSLGLSHSGAVTAEGGLVMWGGNAAGQLGTGSMAPAPMPVLPGLDGIAEVSLGEDHTCARTGGGKILCWGGNAWGQLGDGTTDGRAAPTPVAWPEAP